MKNWLFYLNNLTLDHKSTSMFTWLTAASKHAYISSGLHKSSRKFIVHKINSSKHVSAIIFIRAPAGSHEHVYKHNHVHNWNHQNVYIWLTAVASMYTSAVVRSNKSWDSIGRSCEIQSQQYLLIYDRCPRPPHYPSGYKHKYRYTKHKYECTANTQIQAKHIKK